MTLAGRANWWAPGWLRWVHRRIGISETVDLDDDEDQWTEADEAGRRRLEERYASVGWKD
jgi:hypothetical protein